jgi:hypothetical protein
MTASSKSPFLISDIKAEHCQNHGCMRRLLFEDELSHRGQMRIIKIL